jgi:hypothetical protein
MPQGDLLIADMESPDFVKALRMFAESRDAFDMWFKERMVCVTSLDLNDPRKEPLSERLSDHQSGHPARQFRERHAPGASHHALAHWNLNAKPFR